jgi:hypothetical protein
VAKSALGNIASERRVPERRRATTTKSFQERLFVHQRRGIEIADVSDMAFVNSPRIEHNKRQRSDTQLLLLLGGLGRIESFTSRPTFLHLLLGIKVLAIVPIFFACCNNVNLFSADVSSL